MMNRTERKLVLECGEEYRGIGFGADVDRICEIVFNTAMVGYEEVLSDPANADLGVVMTYPLIGNCGIIEEDLESKIPQTGALIVRDYNDIPSNFRQTNTLSEVMEECGIPGITGVDTRRLTRSLRDNGTMRGMICSADTPTDEALLEIKRTPVRHDAAARVSTKKKWHMRTAKHKSSVIVIDLGIRLSLVRAFAAGASNVTVVPWNTSAAEILAAEPDGVVIAGGPGDPHDVPETADTVRALRGKVPIFGIGLGCDVAALACGAETYRLECDHRGGNHPVRRLPDGGIITPYQNHGYAVREDSLDGTGLFVTYKDLLDGVIEGIACPQDKLVGVQFEPAEDSPVLDEFHELMGR